MSKDRINSGELASLLASQVSGSVREAEDFLKSFVQVIEEQLLANDVLKIKGLGTFKLQWNEPRKSVDVNTAEEILIDGYYKIAFTPEPELKELVNAPFAHLQPVVLGGPDQEEMEEEEVEAVEEEVMKEMEDPGKLEDAMRSITEQAIEIKDILAEMNMMGAVKPAPKPVMVDEDDDVISEMNVAKEKEIAEDTKLPQSEEELSETETEPVELPLRKTNRPGPAVPYGPPPRSEKNAESEDSATLMPEVVTIREVPVAPKPVPPPRKMTEQPIVLPTTSNEDYPSEVEFRRKTRKKSKKSNGFLMLVAGLILGAVGMYFLNQMGLLYMFTQWIKKPQSTQMIQLPETEDYYISDDELADSLTTDSMTTSKVSQKVVAVDSLQLLFDTPRVYTKFIATEEVIEGSRMTRIAERHFGAKEFWVYIYEANRNLLKHPDGISKGMVLKIPLVDPRLLDKNNPRCIEYAVHLHDKYLKK